MCNFKGAAFADLVVRTWLFAGWQLATVIGRKERVARQRTAVLQTNNMGLHMFTDLLFTCEMESKISNPLHS